MNIDVLIITDLNRTKKAIIYYWGNDVHWYVFTKYRNQHILSNALRTGCLKRVWPDLESITCYNSDMVSEFNKTCHLADIAGVKVRENEDEEGIFKHKCRLRAIELGVDKLPTREWWNLHNQESSQ